MITVVLGPNQWVFTTEAGVRIILEKDNTVFSLWYGFNRLVRVL